jgi:DNA sulfur modification protein DndD
VKAEEEAQEVHQHLIDSLRAAALEKGQCDVCEQPVSDDVRARLSGKTGDGTHRVEDAVAAMARLNHLNKFEDADNSALVKELWRTIQEAQMDQALLKDQIADWNAALADSDPDTIRRSQVTLSGVIEKIAVVKRAIEDETKKAEGADQRIQQLRKKLEASGTLDLQATQRRATVLREAAAVFGAAVERYKSELRGKVEQTATSLFMSMTTEKEDYKALNINESYGLTIMHRDGRAEEARSAGAEHVVALALMGALQHNAPLRGPIVMDSPFGRLDEGHTSNVVQTLPDMAEQVVLLVYESEVGRNDIRKLLGSRLKREYELERVSARRTNVVEVR